MKENEETCNDCGEVHMKGEFRRELIAKVFGGEFAEQLPTLAQEEAIRFVEAIRILSETLDENGGIAPEEVMSFHTKKMSATSVVLEELIKLYDGEMQGVSMILNNINKKINKLETELLSLKSKDKGVSEMTTATKKKAPVKKATAKKVTKKAAPKTAKKKTVVKKQAKKK